MRKDMFFNNNDENKAAGGELKTNPQAVSQFYFGQTNYEQTIMHVANGLLKNSAIIALSDGKIFPASHIGEALIFMNTAIQEVCQGGASMNKKQWLNGNLPAGINPKIEIGADKVASYVIETLEKYPTREFDQYLAVMKDFCAKYDSPEIQSALGIKPSTFTRS